MGNTPVPNLRCTPLVGASPFRDDNAERHCSIFCFLRRHQAVAASPAPNNVIVAGSGTGAGLGNGGGGGNTTPGLPQNSHAPVMRDSERSLPSAPKNGADFVA